MESNLLEKNQIELDAGLFDPDVTFNCGQCFRWNQREDGAWVGIAYGHRLTVQREGDNLLISGVAKETFERTFWGYFDLDRDYSAVCRALSADPVLAAAISFAPGMRILRQEPWEALCSFIISQNNNIPRIKGIVSRLCEQFGDPLPGGNYAFPPAERLAGLTAGDLAPLRSGFRAGYILDAAQKVAGGAVELAALSDMPLDNARGELMKIRGVGPKVADCALLFGCGRLDAFPADVWIKRVLARFYPKGFPREYMRYGGIAQQFLFHYARCCPESGF